MSASTRRRFLAGAAAAAAAPVVAQAKGAAPPVVVQAKQRIVRRGRAIATAPGAGALVVAHDHRPTIAIHNRGRKRVVDVGGQPLEVAVSPDGRLAAVTTASWDRPGLAIVDLGAGRLRKRVDVGPSPFGVAFTADGRSIVVSGGEQDGTVHVLDAGRLAVVHRADVGTCPRAVAAAPGGERVWVALNGMGRVVLVNARRGRAEAGVHTPKLPDRVAPSPDGRHLLVSHGGPEANLVSEIVFSSGHLTRHDAGRLPSGVGWTRRGSRLVALGGAGQVLEITRTGRRRTHHVGGAPRGLAVAGNRAWTVDALSGEVAGVRT